MLTRRTAQTTLAVAAGLGLVGALAGCAPGAEEASTAAPTTDASAAGSDSGGTDTLAGDGAGEYADGTYTAEGMYQSPAGPETVTIELTLADNAVTAVSFSSDATNATSKQYQGKFESGLEGAVVGKNVDDISIDKLAGSSLTSGGFTEALETIKSEARA